MSKEKRLNYMKTLSLILLCICFASCSQGPAYTVQKLPSGKEVKIISVGKIYFSEGDPALVLRYETDLEIDNIPALKTEVEEIWETFKFNVDQSGLNNAVIQAAKTTKTSPFTSTAKNYGFVFKKDEEGIWILNEKS